MVNSSVQTITRPTIPGVLFKLDTVLHAEKSMILTSLDTTESLPTEKQHSNGHSLVTE